MGEARPLALQKNIVFLVVLRGLCVPKLLHFEKLAAANIIYVDPDHDLVIVVRWIESSAMNEFIGKVIDAMK